jgi:hypothetical protein
VLRKPFDLAVQHLEALLRRLIRDDVVDADLKIVETRVVQLTDAFDGKQVAIRDERGNRPTVPDVPDDFVKLRVQHWLAAADGNDRGAQIRQQVHSPQHLGQRYRRGHRVELVAVRAGEIAAPDRHDLREDRVLAGVHRTREHTRLANPPACRTQPLPRGPPEFFPTQHPCFLVYMVGTP